MKGSCKNRHKIDLQQFSWGQEMSRREKNLGVKTTGGGFELFYQGAFDQNTVLAGLQDATRGRPAAQVDSNSYPQLYFSIAAIVVLHCVLPESLR